MDKTVLILAGSAVLLPLVVGVVLGHIPKQIFVTWAIPLAAATLGLAFGIRYIEAQSPPVRLAGSVGFGLLWAIGGVTACARKLTTPGAPTPAEKTSRMFGAMFFLFGIVWIAVSVFQYVRSAG